MSTQIFPTTAQCPGLDIMIDRKVEWDTIVQEAVSGKEVRVARRIYPRREFELKFNFLRSSTAAVGQPSNLELQTLEGFFNQRSGMFDSFLWQDPDDNTTLGQFLGTGDGVTTNAQLFRASGGFIDPVYAPSTSTVVYKNDWQGLQVQYTTARSNLAQNSQNITPSAWNSFTHVTLGSTNNQAPDGSFTATTVFDDSVSTQHYLLELVSAPVSSASFYTVSAFAKNGTRRYAGLTGFAQSYVWFDLQNGVFLSSISGSSMFASITPAANGYYRIQCGFFPATAPNSNQFFILNSDGVSVGPNNASYTGSTTAFNYYWGFQIEQSTFMTSYIASSAFAANVTDYTLQQWGSTAPGTVVFGTAPASGVPITADVRYFWPVRFNDDNMTFSRFVNLIYENKKVGFKTII